MIDIRKLKELVRLMVENELTELDLQDKEEKVLIKRGHEALPGQAPVVLNGAPAAQQQPAQADAPAAPPASDAGLVAIESPMVGTYYATPNPDAEPFITEGGNVSPNTTVCLIEAMKVFNEIKAEVSGTVERILVKNGEAVEFGQKLMLVRPS
ncbi:MAG: acetyl-CoA carboxylase biotin carboxyl carrier protein [Phycisphaerales bacterium]|nr:acetyl-CoA carboxylase biotin carboxyl carrier protein [Phycisphaerales bacterium]